MSVDVLGGVAPPRRRRRRGAAVVLVPAAVALAALALWARGLPSFVAWEVARDHQRCFGRRVLPARVWSPDPPEIREWLESRGTPAPFLPARADDVDLVGARYCPLADRVAAHVYYGGAGEHAVSIFLLSGPASIGDGWSGRVRGLHVRLLRATGRTLAVVGEDEAKVAATARFFRHTVARSRRRDSRSARARPPRGDRRRPSSPRVGAWFDPPGTSC